MQTDFKKMRRRIMLRVYYTFGIRLATHTTTLHVVVLAAAGYALGYFVHVAAVLQSAATVPVGDFAAYALRVLSHADAITLLVLGVLIMAALSLPLSLPRYHRVGQVHTV